LEVLEFGVEFVEFCTANNSSYHRISWFWSIEPLWRAY